MPPDAIKTRGEYNYKAPQTSVTYRNGRWLVITMIGGEEQVVAVRERKDTADTLANELRALLLKHCD